MPTPLQIFQSQGLWTWWTQNSGNGTNLFDGISEKGIDFANGFGTPIGVIQGGTVVSVEHNTNSIGDVVVIQGSSGYWLYQHITSNLRVGDTLATGGIVGTENGLPVDQYSTGPHIEVRYSPTYNSGVSSWLQPWINPKSMFNQVGNSPVNDTVPPSINTSGSKVATTSGTNVLSSPVDDTVNQILQPITTSVTNGFNVFLLVVVALVAIGFGVVLLVKGSNLGSSKNGTPQPTTSSKLETIAKVAELL